MDGVIFALMSPMVIKEFSLTVPEYRSGLQIALFVGIAGLYFWQGVAPHCDRARWYAASGRRRRAPDQAANASDLKPRLSNSAIAACCEMSIDLWSIPRL
jgi:hypothetical protein